MVVQFRTHIKNPAVHITNTAFDGEEDDRRKHAAEPIKDMDAILRITDGLVKQGRYRDNLIFIMGINFGFRCGDLLRLQVGHLLDENGLAKEKVTLKEDKTDKYRTVYLNEAVEEALMLYLAGKDVERNDYLFTSQSHNRSSDHLTVYSVERILKHIINEEFGIPIHVGTHTLRKTFGFQVLTTAEDRPRALEKLQRLFNHSSPAMTMHYIGITEDEMRETYKNLNLGKRRTMDFQVSSGLRYA